MNDELFSPKKQIAKNNIMNDYDNASLLDHNIDEKFVKEQDVNRLKENKKEKSQEKFNVKDKLFTDLDDQDKYVVREKDKNKDKLIDEVEEKIIY
mmetsp:Transcript_27498/g.23108  ORF Transcript_27498/g.23108 Transcript_27498/m.23108 type:complete len:95 (-) Transcript_27498:127-411(-)